MVRSHFVNSNNKYEYDQISIFQKNNVYSMTQILFFLGVKMNIYWSIYLTTNGIYTFCKKKKKKKTIKKKKKKIFLNKIK